MQTAIIIPARYGSSRLEGKPLLKACNKPIIQWVWEKAKKVPHVDRVIIATDDERIYNACKEFGAEVEMTSTEHKSGSDRIAEVAQKRFDTYYAQTAPLVEFYQKKGVLHKLDANGSIEDVWARLLKIVE